MIVKTRQYVRPNGIRQVRSFEVADSLQKKYDELNKVGVRIGFEQLSPALVYVFIENDISDYRNVVTDSENLQNSLESLLEEFEVDDYLRWNERMEEEWN